MSQLKNIQYQVIFIILISFYATEVCPHIHNLGLMKFSLSMMVMAIPLAFVYLICLKKTSSYQNYGFWFDFSYFLLLGSLIGIFNFLSRNYPVKSGLKVIVGTLALGFLTTVIYQLEKKTFVPGKPKSLIKDNFIFLVALLSMILVICILMIRQDLQSIQGNIHDNLENLLRGILIESVFIWCVLFAYVSRILYLYFKQIKTTLDEQIKVLAAAGHKDFQKKVTLTSNDELGQIGIAINQMIDDLQAGEAIKDSFQKVTGERLSEEINVRIRQLDFKPSTQNICVLFTDIKSFTSLCETSEPTKFVEDLNKHFTSVVNCIHKEAGVVNKFIGDAILAFFDQADGCERAIRAALRMHRELQGEKFNIGIGIAYGQVLSGLIGSEDRLEYTVIGSTVNLAARLEAATRTLDCTVVCCEATKANCSNPDELFADFSTAKISLKGFDKRQAVVYR